MNVRLIERERHNEGVLDEKAIKALGNMVIPYMLVQPGRAKGHGSISTRW